MKSKLPVLCIISAGILWGTMGLWVRYFNSSGFSSMELVAIRALVSLVIFGIYLFIKDKRLFRISLNNTWIFFGSGIICFIGFAFLYFNTISHSTLAIAAILLYTSPIFVMLFSALLFKERLTVRKIFSLLLAFIGCILVSGIVKGDNNITFTGFLMGIGSGLGYGLYSIFTRYGLNKYDTLTVTFYTFVFAAFGCTLICDIPDLVHRIIDQEILIISILFGIITSVLPYFLYNLGLRNTETSKAAIIACIEPVTATVFSITVFHEAFSLTMLSGIIFVLSAIAILNLKHK